MTRTQSLQLWEVFSTHCTEISRRKARCKYVATRKKTRVRSRNSSGAEGAFVLTSHISHVFSFFPSSRSKWVTCALLVPPGTELPWNRTTRNSQRTPKKKKKPIRLVHNGYSLVLVHNERKKREKRRYVWFTTNTEPNVPFLEFSFFRTYFRRVVNGAPEPVGTP